MAFTHLCEGVNLGLTLLTPPTPHRERGDGVCRDGSISLLRSGPEVRPEPLLPEAEWDVKQKESGSVTSEALRGAKASKPRLPGRPGVRSTHTISSRSADTGSLFPEVARGLWVLCGPVLEGPGFLHCTVEAETFCL